MPPRTLAWQMLFGSILGIAHHPRALQEGEPMTAAEAACRTDEAMHEWDKRFDENGNARAE
jgi:hypothetical protein